jgi:hypothetical protein
MAYRFDGKPKMISFGPYPEASLAEARATREEEKANLRKGIDPMASRKADNSDAYNSPPLSASAPKPVTMPILL